MRRIRVRGKWGGEPPPAVEEKPVKEFKTDLTNVTAEDFGRIIERLKALNADSTVFVSVSTSAECDGCGSMSGSIETEECPCNQEKCNCCETCREDCLAMS